MTQKDFNGRLSIIFLFFLVLFFCVLIRLYLLQVLDQQFYLQLGTEQYGTEVIMQPARGLIYDRKKIAVVHNTEVNSAFVVPNQLQEADALKSWLACSYPSVFERMMENQKSKFLWVDRSVSDESIDTLAGLGLADLLYLKEPQRYYPLACMAPIIGFTNIDNVGIAGVELLFQGRLGGKSATFKLNRDAHSGGFYFTKELVHKGIAGKPVVLTLDTQLQFLAHEELEKTVQEFGAKKGAVIILDPYTGEILAMASVETPDSSTSEGMVDSIKNQPITDCYEFGSVMKAFTALAALEEGLVTNDELIDCHGDTYVLQGLRVTNPFHAEVLPFIEVMKKSANIGLAQIALRLGPKLYDHLAKLGFGKVTGIAFPGERAGYLGKPTQWCRFTPMVMSFGYEISATLLQLAHAFAIVSNGGFSIEPQLYLVPKPKRIKQPVRLYKPKAIAAIKEILEHIGSKYPISGYTVLGKTGTARCVKDGRYSTTDHIYTFGGLIESEKYHRVIVTSITCTNETNKARRWASQVSAPLFHTIAQKMVLIERNH